MPTYDYACAACGHQFEAVHGVHGLGPEACPSCGSGPVRKMIAAPTVVFKGSGWAKMDRRATSSAAKSSKTATDDAGGKSGTGEGGSKTSDAGAAPTAATGDSAPSAPKADSGSSPTPVSKD